MNDAAATDPARRRTLHLLRAGAAAVVIAVLAAWLPREESPTPVVDHSVPTGTAPRSDAPAAAATEGASQPPVVAEMADAPTPVVRADAAGVEVGANGTSPAAGDAGAPAVAPTDPETPPAAAAPASAAAPEAQAGQDVQPDRPLAPSPGNGYMIQLGVFGDPENAERLRQELAGQGYPAHMQSRVVVGPFADRKAAQAAQASLHAERKLEGVILPPRKR